MTQTLTVHTNTNDHHMLAYATELNPPNENFLCMPLLSMHMVKVQFSFCEQVITNQLLTSEI